MALEFRDYPRLFEYVVVNNVPCYITRALWSMEILDRPFLRHAASFFKAWDYVDSIVNMLIDGNMREVFYIIYLQVLEF